MNRKGLFTNSEIQRRKIPEQLLFEKEYGGLLESFVLFANEELNSLHEERNRRRPSYRTKNWAAETFNGFIIGRMKDLFPDKMKPDYGTYSYFGKTAIIKFKKLTQNYLPMNIPTKKVQMERNQLSLLHEPALPIIYVGYVPIGNIDGIKGCYAICLDKWDRINWISDLSNLDFSSNSSIIPTTTLPGSSAEEIYLNIKIKRNINKEAK